MKLSDKEKKRILECDIRNPYPLYILVYASSVVIPYFICMIVTGNYKFWYLNILFVFILLVMIYFPKVLKWFYLRGDVECFYSKIVKCNKGSFYLYYAYIDDIDYKFPVSGNFRKGKDVKVCVLRKNKYRTYILLDKNTGNILSTRRTWLDVSLQEVL